MGRNEKVNDITEEEKAELFDRIEAAEEARRVAFHEMERTKMEAKCAKEAYAIAAEEVQKLAGARKEEHPLFDGQESDGGSLGDEVAGEFRKRGILKEGGGAVNAALRTFKGTVDRLVAKGDVESVTFSSGSKSVTLGKQPASNSTPDAKWRSLGLCAAAFSAAEEALLEAAEVSTMGQLQDLIDQKATIRGVNGNYRTRIEAKLAKYRNETKAE
jgi:hypothetical protein